MSANVHAMNGTAGGVLGRPNDAPHQESMFYECANDALSTCIQSAGGWKHVAGSLWPAMKPESAYARLKACMDDGAREKLTADEIIGIAKLAREKGCHAWAQFNNQELGYAPPVPVDPQDVQDDLMRQFIAAVKVADQISKRLGK